MVDTTNALIHAALNWPGVTQTPHRFGGVEFNLGNIEIGHYHRFGMLDILFNKRIRETLVREARAEHHHLLPETGWISFYTRGADDADHAIWLLRLAYVFQVAKAQRRPDPDPAVAALDVAAALDALSLSDALREALARFVPTDAPTGHDSESTKRSITHDEL